MADQNDTGTAESILNVTVDGEEKSFDLSKPEDREKLQKLASKGFQTDRLYTERASLNNKLKEYESKVKEYDSFNETFEAAKSDDVVFNKLVSYLEGQLGKKLTASQKESIQDDLDYDRDDQLTKLYNKIESLEKDLKTEKTTRASNAILANLDKIVSKPEKYPFANREELIAEAKKRNSTDWEMLYRNLYFDKILAEKVKAKDEQIKSLNEKRSRATSVKGGFGQIKAKETPPKNYREAVQRGLERLSQAQ